VEGEQGHEPLRRERHLRVFRASASHDLEASEQAQRDPSCSCPLVFQWFCPHADHRFLQGGKFPEAAIPVVAGVAPGDAPIRVMHLLGAFYLSATRARKSCSVL
jgi:hypothetical protein